MIDCYCDYDQPEFWSSAIRTARHSHRCEECGVTIQPGERYECVAGKWEGYFDTFKTCHLCYELREWVKANVPCTCWAHGNLHDDLRATIEDAYDRARDEVRGLRFGFLRRLHAIRLALAAKGTRSP